jgi:hypothetical protein
MGQTDVASNLLYADDAMLSFTPMQKLMDYIHTWLNKWRMQGVHQQVMVFHPGESCSVPAKDRRNAWTLGGIAIDQVSKYKYPGRSIGGWIMAARAGARKDASSLWVLEPLLSCSSLPTKVRLLMVQTFICGHVWRVWDTTKAVKDVSGRKISRSLACIPRLLF